MKLELDTESRTLTVNGQTYSLDVLADEQFGLADEQFGLAVDHFWSERSSQSVTS